MSDKAISENIAVYVDGDNPSTNTLKNENEWSFSIIEPIFPAPIFIYLGKIISLIIYSFWVLFLK